MTCPHCESRDYSKTRRLSRFGAVLTTYRCAACRRTWLRVSA